ncbi:unnamed protein product [Discosporangium mesarthrocarpum]
MQVASAKIEGNVELCGKLDLSSLIFMGVLVEEMLQHYVDSLAGGGGSGQRAREPL